MNSIFNSIYWIKNYTDKISILNIDLFNILANSIFYNIIDWSTCLICLYVIIPDITGIILQMDNTLNAKVQLFEDVNENNLAKDNLILKLIGQKSHRIRKNIYSDDWIQHNLSLNNVDQQMLLGALIVAQSEGADIIYGYTINDNNKVCNAASNQVVKSTFNLINFVRRYG